MLFTKESLYKSSDPQGVPKDTERQDRAKFSDTKDKRYI